MLSSQVKFSADRQTDTSKTICPRSIDVGHKNALCHLLRHACCQVCSASCVDHGTAVVYSYTPIKPNGV